MKTAVFYANCPYEIGDKVTTLRKVEINGKPLFSTEIAEITDIACTHYVKSGEIKFTYELNGCGRYLPLVKVPKETVPKRYRRSEI